VPRDYNAAHDLLVQENGKLVVVGEAAVERIRRFVVVRYVTT